jgi:hypothetical protein
MKGRMLLFISMLLVAFQILVSLPIAIWIHNQFNFSAVVWDSVGVLVLTFLAVSVLLFLLTISIPRKIRNYLLPAFVLGSALIYCQQYILVWDYGILNGTPIDFSTNKYFGLIDLFLWLSGAIIYATLRKQILKHSKTILSFTMILTGVATVTTIMSYDFNNDESYASINEIDKFNYSENRNIFLFLLDGFQSDLFWEIIDRNPQLKQEFSGFTFYANTAGVFAKTYPTIPLLLTGRRYQKQQTFQEFLNEVYRDSILNELMSDGWDVGLYPYVKDTITLDSSIMSNYLERTQWPEKIDSYLQALDISIFQSVPHFMKHYIYNDGDFVTKGYIADFMHDFDHLFTTKSLLKSPNIQPHHGLNFRDNLRALGTIDSGKPTFRFYHMFMPHEPFLLNRDLEFGRVGDDFSAYQEYAFASLKLMISYLEELKNLGIYDNSSIIIAADHGNGEHTNQKYISSERRYIPILKNGSAMASGKPLLLVKSYQNDEPLKISSKPVSLLDVAPTIANFADIKPKDIEGRIIDDIEEGQQRERMYYHYHFSGWDSKFLNEFYVYKINGDVYDENSWVNTGKLTARREQNNKKPYVFGSTVKFGSDLKTNADYQNAFLLGNDYEFAASHVVSVDGQILFSINLDSSFEDDEIYLLEIDLASTGKALDVVLELNQKATDTFTVNKNHKQFIFLEPNNLKPLDQLNLRLYDLNHIASSGKFLISELKLQKVNVAELSNDSIISFSDNTDSYFLQGFWQQESWGRWTSKRESSLNFHATVGFCQNSYLLLDINHFYKGVSPESLEVFLNDRKLDFVKVEKINSRKRYYFDCSGFNKTHAVDTLMFKTDKVQVPIITGTKGDSRSLGAGFIGLRFVDRESTNIP